MVGLDDRASAIGGQCTRLLSLDVVLIEQAGEPLALDDCHKTSLPLRALAEVDRKNSLLLGSLDHEGEQILFVLCTNHLFHSK